MGRFSSELQVNSDLHAELLGVIIAIEQAQTRGWMHLWIESDSQLVIQASKSHCIVPWDLLNRRSNCFGLNLQLLFSHVFREGNSCADKLATLGHDCYDFSWWHTIFVSLLGDFF